MFLKGSSVSMQRPITVLYIFSGDLWAGAEVMVFNLLNRLKEFPELKIVALSLNNGILASGLKKNIARTQRL